MNTRILHPDVQDFIHSHLTTDLPSLLFKGASFEDLSIQEIVEQIEAKKRAKHKLPTWFKTDGIYYANKVNIAQSSSEKTATYKASLVHGTHLIDVTGGFGVDTYAFARVMSRVTHCEMNRELSEISTHNFNRLGVQNIHCVTTDGIAYLKQLTDKVDWIFVDPSRRHDYKGKVFLLADCQPNLIEALPTLFKASDQILVKVSPILDLSQTIEELQNVCAIHVVAVENEVKELLFILKKEHKPPIHIHTINFLKDKAVTFNADYQKGLTAAYAAPKTYLYEPNAAILKSGLFNEVSIKLNVDKLHVNSHLYTSERLMEFPGRRFKITANIPFDKKQLRKLIPTQKANITTRNFPISVADIRKKTKLREGGELYLFFTTDWENKRRVLVCEKV
ncbi:RsmD family RNA methyltransferase [Flavobacteriaceae bacterium F08102]|nr:RsmD family RNA methyltransferase [Flavobacteriaceae bacterium F08102]